MATRTTKPTADTDEKGEKGEKYDGFTAAERDAMKERAKELKSTARRGKAKVDTEAELLAKIAEMTDEERVLAEGIHAIVKAAAPHLTPKTWYGMPAYAKDGKVVCFFQPASKFKARYSTLGFNDPKGAKRYFHTGIPGGFYNPGDKIPIRYDPERPESKRSIIVGGQPYVPLDQQPKWPNETPAPSRSRRCGRRIGRPRAATSCGRQDSQPPASGSVESRAGWPAWPRVSSIRPFSRCTARRSARAPTAPASTTWSW